MSNKLLAQYNYLKYRNVNKYKSIDEVKANQIKNIKKIKNNSTSKNKKNTNINNNDIRTGTLLARILPDFNKLVDIAIFHRACHKFEKFSKMNKVSFSYFDINIPILENIARLSKDQPNILIAPPSILMILANVIYNKRLTLNLDKVISLDEVLEDKDRDYFMEQFQVKVIHQIYESRETFIAYTCEYGTLHINEDMLMIEEETIDEERFFPIITNFTKSNNLISKHQLNDILIHKKEPCLCGCHFMAIEKIEGRDIDVFFLKDQQGQDVKIYPDVIRQAIFDVDGIKNYEVIQVKCHIIQINIEYDTRNMLGLSQDKLIQNNIKIKFHKIAKRFNLNEFELIFDKYQVQLDNKVNKVRRDVSSLK